MERKLETLAYYTGVAIRRIGEIALYFAKTEEKPIQEASITYYGDSRRLQRPQNPADMGR